MRRVLVTGASGFVGRHVINALRRRGWSIHAVTRRGNPGRSPCGDHWYRADLLDANARTAILREVRPSHLVHLAWYARPGSYFSHPENDRWVDVTVDLVTEFARQGGRRWMGTGSCAEYGRHSGICTEDETPLAPVTRYGRCKVEAGNLALREAQARSVPACWARLFFLFGPGEPPGRLVSDAIDTFRSGGEFECQEPTALRDFLYVRDAAEALAAVLESDVEGAVNIGSGRTVAVGQLLHRLAVLAGRTDWVSTATGRSPDPWLLLADTRKLTNQVGWRPRFTLEEALKETLGTWRHDVGPWEGP